MKLYTLAINIWHADDYLNDCNTNPIRVDKYLFASDVDAMKFASDVDYGDDIYNEGTLYCSEVDDDKIIELTMFDTIDEFAEAMRGNAHEEVIAGWVMEGDGVGVPIDCKNYDFNKKLEGCILVIWSWQTYVGYARRCEDIRFAYAGETERVLVKRDKSYVNQVDILMTAQEVVESDDLESDLIDALFVDRSWKWTNKSYVDRLIDKLVEDYE